MLTDSTNLYSEDLMTAPSSQRDITNYLSGHLLSLIVPGVWELLDASILTRGKETRVIHLGGGCVAYILLGKWPAGREIQSPWI